MNPSILTSLEQLAKTVHHSDRTQQIVADLSKYYKMNSDVALREQLGGGEQYFSDGIAVV